AGFLFIPHQQSIELPTGRLCTCGVDNPKIVSDKGRYAFRWLTETFVLERSLGVVDKIVEALYPVAVRQPYKASQELVLGQRNKEPHIGTTLAAALRKENVRSTRPTTDGKVTRPDLPLFQLAVDSIANRDFFASWKARKGSIWLVDHVTTADEHAL